MLARLSHGIRRKKELHSILPDSKTRGLEEQLFKKRIGNFEDNVNLKIFQDGYRGSVPFHSNGRMGVERFQSADALRVSEMYHVFRRESGRTA